MERAEATVSQRRLNLIIAVHILFWGGAIFVSPDRNVADLAVLAFLTTLALYPWKRRG